MKAASFQTHHEKISVNSDENTTRKKVVRQDRIEPHGPCTVEIGGKSYPVANYSAFGLAISGEFATKETEFFDVPFIFHNIEVGTLHLRWLKERNGEDISAAFEIIGQPLSMDVMEAISLGHNIVEEQNKAFQERGDIPSDFRLLVYETREIFENLKTELDAIEQKKKFESTMGETDFEDAMSQVVGQYLEDKMPAIYKGVNHLLANYEKDQIKVCMEYFRTQLKDLIFKSPFIERCNAKPLGYAGDYEMMNLLYHNEKLDRSYRSLFVKCLHKVFLEVGAGRAVRNRADYLKAKLTEKISQADGPLKILSLASGPAMEIQKLIREEPSLREKEVEFHLLDQDLGALKHAQLKIESAAREFNCNYKVFFHNTAVRNVISRGLNMTGFDFIYTAGLFDYLTDFVATMTAQKLWEGINQGGELLIGNFNVSNPDQMMMELVLDWELIYRSEEDMKNLFVTLGGDTIVDKEQEEINLFCRIMKNQ